jgi:ligand-binding sensor domain-containing protein
VVLLKRSLEKNWRKALDRSVRLGGAVAVALGALVLPFLASYSSAQTVGWTEAVQISSTAAKSWFPAVAVDSIGRVHVVWTENSRDRNQGLATDSLLYTVWDGESWSAPNDVYTSRQVNEYTLRPAVVIDRADTLHLLYRHPTIYHVRASAGSAWSARAWSAPRRVSGEEEGVWADISIDSQGVLHAVWSENVTHVLPGGVSVLFPGDNLADKSDDAWATYTSSDGLAGDDVLDIVVDGAGVRWFATAGGLGVLAADGSRWMTYNVADGLVSRRVQKVMIDGAGNKWLATQKGVSVLNDKATPFDKSDDVWVTYTVADGLSSDNVSGMAASVTGEVWFATDKGVSVLSVADGEWMTYTTADGLASDFVQAIQVDQAGYKWFGTQRGVTVLDDRHTPFDKSDDVSMTYTYEAGEAGLESSNVLAIASDGRGHRWFGTTSGLSLLKDGGTPFSDWDDVWVAYAKRDGLPDNMVTAITVDVAGNTWVGTAAGVGVLSPANELRAWYTVDDGVAQSFITSISVDQGSSVWLGTQGGEQGYISSDVFYRSSADGGQTWSSPQNLSWSTSPIGNSLHLRIDAQDVIHVVWDETQSCGYTSSSDGGKTWSQRATFYSEAGSPYQIVAEVDGEGQVLVVWRTASESTRFEEGLPIYYQFSADGGLSWSEPAPIPNLFARLLNDSPFDAYDMAVDSAGHVHLVVVGRTSAVETALSVLHTEWDGSNWSPPTKVFSGIRFSERPAITISEGNQVHVVWFVRDSLYSAEENIEIWYARGLSAAPFVPAPPSPTPLPTATATPTPIPPSPPTPYPTLAPGTGGLPTGLYTESDEILQLAVALLPLALLILVVMVIRSAWLGKLLR